MRGIAAGFFTLCVAARVYAQPAEPAEPDYPAAKQHYDAGTTALDAGQYDQAIDELQASYQISQDPVLFFKIGTAYEKAGKCSDAIGYYERYLNEAKPDESFVALTKQRIDACKAQLPPPAPEPKSSEPAPAAASPAAAPAQPPAEPMHTSANKDRAWLFVGGTLAFATAGAVLAYSISSVEQDIDDLYISNNGMPPEWNDKTQQRLDDLNAQGHRYEVLAWTSFGLAAACGIGATFFFVRASHEVEVAPVVSPKQAGAAVTLHF